MLLAWNEYLDTVGDKNFFLGDPLLDELDHFCGVLCWRYSLNVQILQCVVNSLYLNLIEFGDNLLPMNKTEFCDAFTIKCLHHWCSLLRLLGRLYCHIDQCAQEETICDHEWIEVDLQGQHRRVQIVHRSC